MSSTAEWLTIQTGLCSLICWLKRTKRHVLAASKWNYFSSLYGVEMVTRDIMLGVALPILGVGWKYS